MRVQKRYIIPAVIIVLVVVARILLPIFVLRYVNKTINDIPGYVGHVEDIDIALYRGAYVIKGLTMDKENAIDPPHFLDFPKTDISIEWDALFDGEIVSEIEMHNPEMNFIFEDQKKPNPEGEAEISHWSETLADLVPIAINHFQVHNGQINFVQLSASPDINLNFSQIALQATNLRNVIQKNDTLPSSINATAVSFGGGSVSLNGRMDIIRKIPNVNLDFALTGADVTAINDMSKHFAGVDFASGTFELYSEVAIANGYLEGYIKPMFIDTEIIGEEDKGFFEKLWEGFVGVFKFLLRNQETDTLATRAPLQGDLNNLDTGLLTTILNIFKNGWIEAFSTDVDENIEYEDALNKAEEDD